jgi:hypothetical protein
MRRYEREGHMEPCDAIQVAQVEHDGGDYGEYEQAVDADTGEQYNAEDFYAYDEREG